METFTITIDNKTTVYSNANSAAKRKTMLENMGARLVDYGRKSIGSYYWIYKW